jgi:pyruvate kinase
MTPDKKVKILATLGPAVDGIDDIRELVEAGVNIFRLNFSHGDHADHAKRYQWIREVERQLNYPLGILMDLQGPKLRVGKFADGKVQLHRGQAFRLDLDTTAGDERRVNLPHPEIIAALEAGMDLLLDDGKLRLRVVTKYNDAIDTTVLNGGELSDRKGVNVPQAVLDLSPLTAKDRRDLSFGLELGVDWVALSFVQRPQDIVEARALIGDKAFLMAKIEKPSAVEQLREIAELSDAIMVARGDLGVEVPKAPILNLTPNLQTARRLSVPQIQKNIITTCRALGKPVVVATQMLESMRFSPAPTRAEVTDVANAVAEGADAVMLSAETASGEYPLEAVQMMSKIIRQVENGPDYQTQLDVSRPKAEATVSDAISCAIRRISNVLPVAVLVNYSESGASTLRASRERPKAPILNLTPNLQTARRLSVAWGIHSVVNDRLRQVDEVCSTALEIAQAQGMAERGDTLLITAGVPFGQPGSTNSLRIETLI